MKMDDKQLCLVRIVEGVQTGFRSIACKLTHMLTELLLRELLPVLTLKEKQLPSNSLPSSVFIFLIIK